MAKHRIYTMSVASVYPHYVAKAVKKNRTKAEVDEIIRWLTGYTQDQLEQVLAEKTSWIKEQGLAGAMVWSINQDDEAGTLLNAISKGLQGETTFLPFITKAEKDS